jgi:hypothetical protein
LIAQFALKRDQIIFEVKFERGDVGMSAFCFCRALVREQEIIPGAELRVHQNLSNKIARARDEPRARAR